MARLMLLRCCACLMLAANLAGCGVGYYWQAAGGQLEILRKRRPIEEVLADGAVAEPIKTKLRRVLEVQEFGMRALALPAEGRYTRYADLGRPNVSWLVVASEPFALHAVEQCYWIVGCLDYRGYFAREDAEAFAAGLAAEGKDVLVRPVRAYSTLGWFDDPVLNTFLEGSDDLDVIATILHEQAHRVLFVKGDTAFNESFAVFVERQGVERYLAGLGDPGQTMRARYDAEQADEEHFRAIVQRGRERLERLYASGLDEPALREEKARLFDRMRQDYQNEKNSFTIVTYDHWFEQPLNNAHLVSITLYESRVGAFRALFRRNGEDFARCYEAARALGALPEAERADRLEELERQDAATERDGAAPQAARVAQGQAAGR